MNTQPTNKTAFQKPKHTFVIEIYRDLTEHQLEYIFDCWCEYWCCDFGYLPKEYSMTLK